ncbi:response regulator [Nitrincola sp.]|uniref:response regulator n=1 Tax=Nitrincola sp. TaxID=1926584 RepID=UPI003A8FFFB3
MIPIKILLVDDQNLIREGIKSLIHLRPDMQVVAEADDGTEVLNLITCCQPDILLLDIRMPQVSGQEVLKQLQTAGLNIPVLILTTFDDHELVLDCIKLGAKGYLRKDVSFDTLTQAIQNLTQGKTWIHPATSYRVDKARHQLQPTETPIFDELTDSEIQVLRLVAAGYSNHEIAAALFKSPGTIRNQVSSILNKLNVRDRTRAVLKALDLELI